MPKPRSNSPKPWRQFGALTLFLRIPRQDWAAVSNGLKTEFRGAANALTRSAEAQAPALIVAYAIDSAGQHQSKLMVLEKTWREPLMAISPESLAREGFPTFAHFRRYWMGRHRRYFEPMRTVQAYQLRLFKPADLDEIGIALAKRLYQQHLPPELRPEIEDID